MPLEPLGRSDWFANDASGNPITRRKNCEVCRKEFTQRLLSERFMQMIERRGPNAMAKLRLSIPDLYVPVYCPSCERMALDHEGRKAEQRGAA